MNFFFPSLCIGKESSEQEMGNFRSLERKQFLYSAFSCQYIPNIPNSHPSEAVLYGGNTLWSRRANNLVRHTGTPSWVTGNHGLINYIDTKAKCRHLKIYFAAGCLSVWGPLPYYDPIPHTYSYREGGGELTREKVREATVHKAGSKIPTWLTVSPVYKLW